MSTSVFEIVELPNGDIALQRADGEGEPMVCIHFSEEAKSVVEANHVEVAKAMIDAGIQMVGRLNGLSLEEDLFATSDSDSIVLH